MTIKFKKMHGLSNNFVIIDFRGGVPMLSQKQMAAITDRKTGVGCDQLIPVLPPKDPAADVFMRIINSPDATECEIILNGGPLQFHWREKDDHLLMTGPVAYVFDGTLLSL